MCFFGEKASGKMCQKEGQLDSYAVYPSSQGQKDLLKSSNAIGEGFWSGISGMLVFRQR